MASSTRAAFQRTRRAHRSEEQRTLRDDYVGTDIASPRACGTKLFRAQTTDSGEPMAMDTSPRRVTALFHEGVCGVYSSCIVQRAELSCRGRRIAGQPRRMTAAAMLVSR